MSKTDFEPSYESMPNWMKCAIKELNLVPSTIKVTVHTPLSHTPEQYFGKQYIPADIHPTGQVIIKIEGWRDATK